MRRKLGMPGLLWVCLGVAAVAPVMAAEPPSPRSFLLRYYYLDVTETARFEKEVLVFRDGLVVERFSARYLDVDYQIFLRSQPLPEDFDRLEKALADFRVGQVVGNCTSRMVPRPEESFTWFGRGERQNTFLVGKRFAEPCSSETEGLILELLTFFLNSGAGGSESVELR